MGGLRVRVGGVVALVLSVVPPAPANGARPVDEALRAALEALQLNDSSRALTALGDLTTRPVGEEGAAEARFIAARALLNSARPDEALRLATDLEGAMPEAADFVWRLLAHAHRAAGRWNEARAAWQTLVERFADSPLAAEAHYGVADASFAVGDFLSARASYEAALAREPRGDRALVAHYNLGRIAEAQGRATEAVMHYGMVSFRLPWTALGRQADGRLWALVAQGKAPGPSFGRRLGRFDKLLRSRSIDDAEHALDTLAGEANSVSRGYAVALRRAELLFARGQADAAAELLHELASTSSGRRRASLVPWLARAYGAVGRIDDAIAAYQELWRQAAGRRAGRDALFHAAWLAFNGKNYVRAIELFRLFLERYPSDSNAANALWYLAWTTYRTGDLLAASELLDRIQTRTHSAELTQRSLYWQGRCMTQMGRAAEARQAFVEARSRGPLSYYGVLARERLAELDKQSRPLAFGGRSILLASLDTPRPQDEDSGGGEAPEVPDAPSWLDSLAPGESSSEAEGPSVPVRQLPAAPPASRETSRLPIALDREDGVFDWSTERARRARRLARLGLSQPAAVMVRELTTRPGTDRRLATLARARLLYRLGDYAGAYRLAAIVPWPEGSDGVVDAELRNYLEIAYPRAHERLVASAAGEFGVAPLLVLAVMRQESAFDPAARSPAGAWGLMQIIPPTGENIAQALTQGDFAVEALTDPAVSVRFGAWYLAELVKMFAGDLVLAIASYNAGPQAVTRWAEGSRGAPIDELVEEIPYRETRRYVREVVGNLAVYSALYAGKDLQLPLMVSDARGKPVEF